MGELIQLRPPVIPNETFYHVETLDVIGVSELVICRSEVEGRAVLSLLLSDLPEDGSFEILASVLESESAPHALKLIGRAVSLAVLHLMPVEDA